MNQYQKLLACHSQVYMVSEGVQTNGFSRRSSSDTQTSPPNRIVRPPQQQPPLPPYQDPPPPPTPQSPSKKKPQLQPKPTTIANVCSPHEVKTKPYLPPHIAGQLPGYQLQIYHLDGTDPSPKTSPQASWYGTAPRSGKHQHHHSHHKHSHNHNHHGKATRSHSSGNVLDENFETSNGNQGGQQGSRRGSKASTAVKVSPASKAEKCSKHLQKSLSEGKLTEEPNDPSVQAKPQKAVKFLEKDQPTHLPSVMQQVKCYISSQILILILPYDFAET